MVWRLRGRLWHPGLCAAPFGRRLLWSPGIFLAGCCALLAPLALGWCGLVFAVLLSWVQLVPPRNSTVDLPYPVFVDARKPRSEVRGEFQVQEVVQRRLLAPRAWKDTKVGSLPDTRHPDVQVVEGELAKLGRDLGEVQDNAVYCPFPCT